MMASSIILQRTPLTIVVTFEQLPPECGGTKGKSEKGIPYQKGPTGIRRSGEAPIVFLLSCAISSYLRQKKGGIATSCDIEEGPLRYTCSVGDRVRGVVVDYGVNANASTLLKRKAHDVCAIGVSLRPPK